MYERFTDRSRRVIQLANHEAQRFNHEYIGTEHILLALIREDAGVAANVLKNLDVDLLRVRAEVEKIVQTGADMVTGGTLPQTPRAKKVLEYAMQEARTLKHNYVGTEHLLLGLLREEEGVAAQVLLNLGLTLEAVRAEVLSLLGLGQSAGAGSPAPAPALTRYCVSWTERVERSDAKLAAFHTQTIHEIARRLKGLRRNSVLLLVDDSLSADRLLRGLAESEQIFELDAARLVADSRFCGEFEKHWLACCDEATREKAVIVIRESSIRGWDRSPQHTALVNMLSESVRSGRVRTILLRERSRWDTVRAVFGTAIDERCTVVPFTADMFEFESVLATLADDVAELAQHHRVTIPRETVDAVVSWTRDERPADRIVMPADVLDQAAARVRGEALESEEYRTQEAELLSLIEELNREKEDLVSRQEFDRAAEVRDRQNDVRSELDALRIRLSEHEVGVDLAREEFERLAGPT